jgi:hypothetical protein
MKKNILFTCHLIISNGFVDVHQNELIIAAYNKGGYKVNIIAQNPIQMKLLSREKFLMSKQVKWCNINFRVH